MAGPYGRSTEASGCGFDSRRLLGPLPLPPLSHPDPLPIGEAKNCSPSSSTDWLGDGVANPRCSSALAVIPRDTTPNQTVTAAPGRHDRTSTHMRTASTLQRLMASSLSLLLISCSAARHSAPDAMDAHELSRLVLVIQEAPNAQVTHSWEPMSSFDLSKYPYRSIDSGVQGRIVRAAWTRNCEDEFDACVDTCMKSLRGPNWSHANRGSRAAICRDRCRPAYNDCCRLRDQAEALKFPVIDHAVDWLKRHREELLVGTVLVIAGVAFVVVVAGSGGTALVLVPAVLLVSSEAPSESPIAAALP
jgi:hypothetical protein